MKNFEFKSQICTTKEQSERLIALGLKKETADMEIEISKGDNTITGYVSKGYWHSEMSSALVELIPAWSLHRLLFLIPKEVNIDGFKFPLRSDVIMRLEDADFIYARLIGVIERVIKEGFINQDYLEERK